MQQCHEVPVHSSPILLQTIVIVVSSYGLQGSFEIFYCFGA